MLESDYLKENGLQFTYFSTIRSRRTRIYRYYCVLGKGNLAIGRIKYFNLSSQLRNRIIEILYTFDSEKDFAKWLYEHGVYATKGVAKNFVSSKIFEIDRMHVKTFIKIRLIIKLFNKKNNA